MTNISHRKMGPRGPPRIEEQLKMMKSRFESVLDPDDPFLQHGLGLLLIAKSANDSLFHKLVASIKSPEEGTRDQARRTLSRWAKSNQRVDQTTSYSSLVEKAENLPPDKREIVLNHFKAIPTCDDEGEAERCNEHGGKGREHGIFRNPNEALRAARRVSRSLLERLETTPTTKLEGPGPGEDSAPAEGAVPGKGVEQSSERECPEGEIEKDSNPSGQANGGKENDEEQEQEDPAENDENGTTQVAQTSMSPLPTAPHLASAASGHSIGSASPPDPPAPAEAICRRSNPARRQTRFFQADGESGTCPTSTRPETRIAFEGANLKERRGEARGKGCDRVGVNSSHQRQNGASEQGGMEKTPGAQTSQQSGSGAMLTAQLEQVASTIAELTELQKVTDEKLAASLQRIEGVMQQKIVPSLQRIEDAVNRYLEQSQRTGPDSGQRAAMGTLPVAEVIGVAVGASHQSETVGRSTANGRTRRQRGVEAGQAQRRIQRTGTNSGRRAAGSVSGANVPGGAAADTLPVAEEVDLIVGTSDQVETGGRSAARGSQGEVGEVQHEIYIPNGEPSSNLVHERIFAVYFGGL